MTDLVVPAAPCVQLASHRANNLRQAPLISSVDVFVTLLDLKSPVLPFPAYFAEAICNGASFLLCHYSCLAEGFDISLASLHNWGCSNVCVRVGNARCTCSMCTQLQTGLPECPPSTSSYQTVGTH